MTVCFKPRSLANSSPLFHLKAQNLNNALNEIYCNCELLKTILPSQPISHDDHMCKLLFNSIIKKLIIAKNFIL